MWSRARLPDFAFQTDHEIEQPFQSQETIIMVRNTANGASQNGKAKSKLVSQIARKARRDSSAGFGDPFQDLGIARVMGCQHPTQRDRHFIHSVNRPRKMDAIHGCREFYLRLE